MMEGDFSRAKMIFEQASRVDFSQYPIEEHKPKTISPGSQTQEPPLYGSGAFGFMIDIWKKVPATRLGGDFFQPSMSRSHSLPSCVHRRWYTILSFSRVSCLMWT